ncbi:DUF6499 domain-containing protein [Mesorhizobium sp. M0276]|uniref:transcriptional regulator domain-containing protein n=1 Tax=Mesorhizobium sp. M0276 TaxID=2956928 RepID=UPI0033393347
MRPDTSQWRSSSTYDYLDDLVAADLAWEWLRRNANYQRDYAEVEDTDTDRQRLAHLVQTRWGLRFPCPPNFQRHRDRDILDAGSRSGHRHSYSDPGNSGLGRRCAT